MKEYMHISVANVEPMSLTMARIITDENIRPELDPQENQNGYFVLDDDGYKWFTLDEFKDSNFFLRAGADDE